MTRRRTSISDTVDALPVIPSQRRTALWDTNDARILSRDACRAVADRVFAMGKGGGQTGLQLNSVWSGQLRWGRNDPSYGGADTQESTVNVGRNIRGAGATASINALDDAALQACVAWAERALQFNGENPDQYPDPPPPVRPMLAPVIWFEETYNVDAAARGRVAAASIAPAVQAGLLAGGYFRVGAHAHSVVNTDGLFRYYPYTGAQYTTTVRDVAGTGSGWAGVDWNDWRRIDTAKLSAIALDKCQRSRNPVALEPGRYTVILEPQAVCDLVAPILDTAMDRESAEMGYGPFGGKMRTRVMDARVRMSADPMDPDCGFVPFDWTGEPYRPVTWIEHGVLQELAYYRDYAIRELGQDTALPNSEAFHLRVEGAPATIEEMIATTKRGVLVTRFSGVQIIQFQSMLLSGNTRDGLWLIEDGKISKPIKNFRFVDSPLFVLNKIEQFGVPQRVFRPAAPAVVPALKVTDFSFTGLVDAV